MAFGQAGLWIVTEKQGAGSCKADHSPRCLTPAQPIALGRQGRKPDHEKGPQIIDEIGFGGRGGAQGDEIEKMIAEQSPHSDQPDKRRLARELDQGLALQTGDSHNGTPTQAKADGHQKKGRNIQQKTVHGREKCPHADGAGSYDGCAVARAGRGRVAHGMAQKRSWRELSSYQIVGLTFKMRLFCAGSIVHKGAQAADGTINGESLMAEEVSVFLRGVVLGLVIAAPIGPTGFLCVRRTLRGGFRLGMATGVGAALADALFSGVAAFSVSAVATWLAEHARGLQTFGGSFLLAMAIHAFMQAPRPLTAHEPAPPRALTLSALSGFVMTGTNPVTILGMTALTLGFGRTESQAQAAWLVGGILMGSLAWWAMLCGGASLAHGRANQRNLHRLNLIVACILAAFGAYALAAAWGGAVLAIFS
jgi:threonine/homoserine/homoserine lactone efflux protein